MYAFTGCLLMKRNEVLISDEAGVYGMRFTKFPWWWSL